MALLLRKCIVSLSKLNLTRHQTLLFTSSAKISVPTADFLTTQYHISPETALKASLTISHLKKPHNTHSILSCLRQTGFSLPQIDLIINRYPRVLNRSPEALMKKLKMFEDNGLSTSDIVYIVSKNPHVLRVSLANRLEPSIYALKATLGSTDAACRVLKKLTWFLEKDLGKTMIPNIEFFKKRSELSSSQVAEYVILCPRFFLFQPETIEDGARRLDEMGLKWTSKMYLRTLKVVCEIPEEKLKLKMNFFRGLGLSENEVLGMFNRYPNIFGCSEKNIKETIEVLKRSGKIDQSFPRRNTDLLAYSLEKRIKPRLEVIRVLEDKGLVLKSLCLSPILRVTDNKFLERFVLPNSVALGDSCVIDMTKKLALDLAD